MNPVTFYRLGQLRHAEILQQAEDDRQPRVERQLAATAPIGRLLLAWGARLVGSSGCAKAAAGTYTVTVCPAGSSGYAGR